MFFLYSRQTLYRSDILDGTANVYELKYFYTHLPHTSVKIVFSPFKKFPSLHIFPIKLQKGEKNGLHFTLQFYVKYLLRYINASELFVVVCHIRLSLFHYKENMKRTEEQHIHHNVVDLNRIK